MVPAAVLEHDSDLMLRVREGDTQSFTQLLNRYRGPVIHYLSRMIGDRARAEELAQEVFLRVYRSRERYEPSAKFTTWLFRIATHLALNSLRDGRHERRQDSLDVKTDGGLVRQVPDAQPNPEEYLLHQARRDEIRCAVAALPAKQRAAVLMHKYEEMDYAGISEALGCSPSAVKSLLFRAYETLRTRLAHLV